MKTKKNNNKLSIPLLRRCRRGISLVELTTASIAGLIVLLAAGFLLTSGHRIWQQNYNSVHSKSRIDARSIVIAFGNIARQSNRSDYIIYDKAGNVLVPVEPIDPQKEEVVSGNAIEFRYWDVPLDKTDSHNLLDNEKTATAYALFYLEGDNLMVDYGQVPPGAAPSGGGARNTSDISSMILAENVSRDDDIEPFSHTVVGGKGNGAVRINVIVTDPDTGRENTVVTSVRLRNTWPK